MHIFYFKIFFKIFFHELNLFLLFNVGKKENSAILFLICCYYVIINM